MRRYPRSRSCWPAPSRRANGRPPLTNGMHFGRAIRTRSTSRTTFGLLVSHDDGCTFSWVCEQNIGYGGTFDPKYAIATDGTIFATTFPACASAATAAAASRRRLELAGAPTASPRSGSTRSTSARPARCGLGTAESGEPNDVFVSTNDGVTFRRPSIAVADDLLQERSRSRRRRGVYITATGRGYATRHRAADRAPVTARSTAASTGPSRRSPASRSARRRRCT